SNISTTWHGGDGGGKAVFPPVGVSKRSDTTERLNKDFHEPRASGIFSTVSAVRFVF
ncbi:unnamed protein product, partial [Porites lobata]